MRQYIMNMIYVCRYRIMCYHLKKQESHGDSKIILSVDDIMYIDAAVNEVAVDFIIVRPNKGFFY